MNDETLIQNDEIKPQDESLDDWLGESDEPIKLKYSVARMNNKDLRIRIILKDNSRFEVLLRSFNKRQDSDFVIALNEAKDKEGDEKLIARLCKQWGDQAGVTSLELTSLPDRFEGVINVLGEVLAEYCFPRAERITKR